MREKEGGKGAPTKGDKVYIYIYIHIYIYIYIYMILCTRWSGSSVEQRGG